MFRPTIREESFGVIATSPDGSIDLFRKDAKALFAEKRFTEMRKMTLGDSKTIVRQKREGVFRVSEFDIPLGVLNQSSILKSPLVIQLELTTLCNLRCKFCFSKAGVLRENELPTSEIKRVIRQLKQEDVSSFFLTGGEPTLHPDFVEIVNLISELGLDCFILTNGTQLNTRLLGKIPNSVYIVMSFDGINTHINSHGGLNFDAVKERFSLLKSAGFPFSAQYVLHRKNIADLERTYQWCGENEIDFAAIDLYPTGRAMANPEIFLIEDDLNDMLCLAEAKFRYEQIQSTWVDRHVDVPNPFYFSFIARLEEIFERSFSGSFFASISSDGIVFPDNFHAGERMFPAGDIRKQDFAEIWHHGFEKVRELCKWDNFKCCKSCELSRYYCDFRLPVFSFNLHGNYNSCGTPKAQKHLMLERVRLREKTADALSPDDAREKDNW
jgi:MoaA/NifB/PqqE/SkfB family radical SAM enzyme